MKRGILLACVVTCVIGLITCTYEPEQIAYDVFSVTEARAYFENNAEDLQNVDFGKKSLSRSSMENLYPEWGKAEITQEGTIITMEIPLNGDVLKRAMTMKMGMEGKLQGYMSTVDTRLIIQKHVSSGLMRQFVVTMIDGMGSEQKKEDRKYCGGSHYYGYVIISSLSGQYITSFQSVNGLWKKVFMGAGSKEQLNDPQNVGIRLSMIDGASTYDIGESVKICPKCTNSEDMCTCCKYCDNSGCDSCMVIVRPICPVCGQTTVDCKCCPVCKHYPCQCIQNCPNCKMLITFCVCDMFRCPNCGELYCNGSCQTPPSGESGAGGSGESGGEGGEGEGQIPDPCAGLLFEGIMGKIALHEGGFSNHPNDKGGPTNKGIAWATWKDNAMKVLGVEPTLENLKALTDEQAIAIYKKVFWNKAKIDEIDDPDMRYALFDFYINAGGYAIAVLQKTLNSLQSDVVLSVDKAMGPKTIACLNSLDHRIVYNALLEARGEYYRDLVEREPDQRCFLNGWLNRVRGFTRKTEESKYNVNC